MLNLTTQKSFSFYRIRKSQDNLSRAFEQNDDVYGDLPYGMSRSRSIMLYIRRDFVVWERLFGVRFYVFCMNLNNFTKNIVRSKTSLLFNGLFGLVGIKSHFLTSGTIRQHSKIDHLGF